MKRSIFYSLLPISCFIFVLIIAVAIILDHSAIQVNQISPVKTGPTIIIDPGHGMPDGGAVSCTGILESDINLEISERLNDFLHLFGIQTVMTRTDRDSIYTEGNSIGQKKVSDTRNRVALINGVEEGILISIHQNHFYDSQYSGAQVFYAGKKDSEQLAKELQSDFVRFLNPGSNRKAKRSSGVYIMEHIQCTGVLIECGFLSNPNEEGLLRSANYQKILCGTIVTSCQSFMNQQASS